MTIELKIKRTLHLSQSIEGALKNWSELDWGMSLLNDDGSYMNSAKAKSIFLKLKDEGKRVLPIGHCPNFDYQKGCLCLREKK